MFFSIVSSVGINNGKISCDSQLRQSEKTPVATILQLSQIVTHSSVRSTSVDSRDEATSRIDREDAKGEKQWRETGIRTSSLAARIARADSHGAR